MSASPAKKRPSHNPFSVEETPGAKQPGGPLEICIVSPEFVGPAAHGGAGLACTAMAQALAAAGHRVTCLFLGPKITTDSEWQRWVEKYQADGLSLTALPHLHASTLMGPANLVKSYEAFQWLKKNDRFDIIHFPEHQGPGYHSLTAKHHGLAFKNATICVGIHQLTAWLPGAGAKPAGPAREVDTDFMERKAIALADAVVGPNQNLVHWISGNRGESAESTGGQAIPLPAPDRPESLSNEPSQSEITELVYFGRLEEERGLAIFCGALEELPPVVSDKLKTVTFLGTEAIIDGLPAQNYIEKRAQNWPFAVQFIADLHETGTVNYLRQKGRLAVIPTLVEGSPYRVMECLIAGIAFIASRVGGIAKIIAAEDAEKVCFEPNAQALCARLTLCLTEGIRPARSAGDTRKQDAAKPVDVSDAEALQVMAEITVPVAPSLKTITPFPGV
jgi:glycosyltransferase involved in cell wall biosynthesis